jgi:hypothetical protein
MFKLVLACPAAEFKGRLSSRFKTSYHLKGKWEVAVTKLKLDKTFNMVLCCDLVRYTHVGDQRMRFLEYYDAQDKANNPKPTYVSIANKRFDSINVDLLRYPELTSSIESKSDVICVLHFRKS